MLFRFLTEELSDSSVETSITRMITAVQNSNASVTAAAIADQITEHDDPCRILNFYQSTVPMYSEVEFRSHFRMLRTTTEARIIHMG